MSAVDGPPAEPSGARASVAAPGQSDLAAAPCSSPAAPAASARASPAAFLARWRAGAGLRADRARPSCRARDGRTALFTRADVRDPEQAPRTVRTRQLSFFSRLDVVVSNAGGSPYAGGRHRVAPVPRQDHRAQPDRAAARRAGRQRGHAGPGRRRLDHHDRQRQRHPAVARHRRLRRGQGRPAPPGHQPRGRVGARRSGSTAWCPGSVATESAAEHYGDPATVGRRRRDRAARAGWRPRTTWPSACLFLASRWRLLRQRACLPVHGGGERPAYLAAQRPVYAPNE